MHSPPSSHLHMENTRWSSPKTGGQWLYWATLTVGLGLWLVDELWTGSPVTPLFALCWLMAVGIRYRTSAVRRMALILCVFVVASLWEQDWDRLIVRAVTFCAGSMLAVMYANSRERSSRLLAQLRQMVEQVPAAIITADAMGCVLSARDEMKKLAGSHFSPLEGHSLPDVLMGQLPPGEAMRRYLEWFQRDGVYTESFTLREHDGLQLEGRVICSGKGDDRILIAVLR